MSNLTDEERKKIIERLDPPDFNGGWDRSGAFFTIADAGPINLGDMLAQRNDKSVFKVMNTMGVRTNRITNILNVNVSAEDNSKKNEKK